MLQEVSKLFGALGSDFDLVFVAVVVGQVERCEAWVSTEAPEE